MLVSRFLLPVLALQLGAGAAVAQPGPPAPPGAGRPTPPSLAPVLPALPGPPPAAALGPLRVTTDTPEYCDSLAERVARAEHTLPRTLPEVEELAEEGHQMCNSGLVRGGLVRLRRALMLLRADR